jgi:hypothetical protein
LVGGLQTVEGRVEQPRNRWAGIVDLKSGHANFIGWLGENPPSDVYFSNHAGQFSDASYKVPLTSNEVFIGLQWIGQRLAPGEGLGIQLVIGLADKDPVTGKPRLPPAAAGP